MEACNRPFTHNWISFTIWHKSEIMFIITNTEFPN